MTKITEESHDECGRKAVGILVNLQRFTTYFGLCLAYMIFSPTEQLSKTLQTTDMTLQHS